MQLNETSRNKLISVGRDSTKSEKEKGTNKNRFEMRLNSRIANSVQEYNKIDMNKLFKKNNLTFKVRIYGETDKYMVTLSFDGFLDKLKARIGDKDTVSFRDIQRALIDAYNSSDIKFFCTCPDFKYRIHYWATEEGNVVGKGESRASDKTNPNNDKGPACKHIMLVLSNANCITKIASVINNYIKYAEKNMKKEYANIIYPAIFGKKYEEPYQLALDDPSYNRARSSQRLIKQINKQQGQGNKFQKGNQGGVQFAKKDADDVIDGQMSLFDDEV